jgi:hypothetical protein
MISEPGARGGQSTEVVNAAVVDGEDGIDGDVVEIGAELQSVRSVRDREVVAELVTLLGALDVGVRLASDECVANDVGGDIGPASAIGVEVLQSATGILEAELIDLVVADGPGVLEYSSDVAIGLLRGAGVSVLAEGLVLAVDLNAGDCAWADITAQHDAVRRGQIVVEPQRVKAGAFEDRVVPNLSIQREKA